MIKNKSILWITRTAVSLALLITAQIVLRVLGQYVLGSIVNLILISTAFLMGISESITIAVLSPLLAFLLGFGPALPQIVPVVIVGNISLVFIWYIVAGKNNENTIIRMVIALVLSAVVKFSVLWSGIVKIVIPLLNIQNPQAAILSAAFSYPQLITATIGGIAAVIILPPLKRMLNKNAQQVE